MKEKKFTFSIEYKEEVKCSIVKCDFNNALGDKEKVKLVVKWNRFDEELNDSFNGNECKGKV